MIWIRKLGVRDGIVVLYLNRSWSSEEHPFIWNAVSDLLGGGFDRQVGLPVHALTHMPDSKRLTLACALARVVWPTEPIRLKGSNRTALAMVFKLVEAAQRSWRPLDGHNQLPKLILGVRFTDGLRPAVSHTRRLTHQKSAITPRAVGRSQTGQST